MKNVKKENMNIQHGRGLRYLVFIQRETNMHFGEKWKLIQIETDRRKKRNAEKDMDNNYALVGGNHLKYSKNHFYRVLIVGISVN